MSIRKYRYQPPLPPIALRLVVSVGIASTALVAGLDWQGPLAPFGKAWVSVFQMRALCWVVALLGFGVAGCLAWAHLEARRKPMMVVLHPSGLSLPHHRADQPGEYVPYDSMARVEVRGSGGARQIEIDVAAGTVCIAQRCMADGLAFDSLVDALADKLSLSEENRTNRPGQLQTSHRTHRQIPGAITTRPAADPVAAGPRASAPRIF